MNKLHIFFVLFCASLLISCGGSDEQKKETIKFKNHQSSGSNAAVDGNNVSASEWVDLVNIGVGPVKSVEMTDDIDQSMVERGAAVYNRMCTACHRIDKKFVGPPVKGILERRTPEWVMNMLLNPDEMLKKDPIAKALFEEFYGVPMVNQYLTHKQARDILEYYRTLE